MPRTVVNGANAYFSKRPIRNPKMRNKTPTSISRKIARRSLKEHSKANYPEKIREKLMA